MSSLEAGLGLTTAQIRALNDSVRTYLDGLDGEFSLLLDGDLTEARAVDQQRVDPQYAQLSGLLQQQSAGLNAAARTATTVTRAGVLLLVPLSLTLAGLLGLRLSRTAQVSRSRARFEAMVAGASDIILVTDADGTVLYASPSVTTVLGDPAGTWAGADIVSRVHPDDQIATRAAVTALIADPEGALVLETRMLHADQGWRTIEHHLRNMAHDPAIAALVWNSRDVTDRHELEAQLEHRAFHDTLTGLANRALFADRLGQSLARRARGSQDLAVLLVDLDGFKDINDSLGHDAGDEVLTEISRRLAAALRPGDTVARLGGDEFAVLLDDLPHG